MDEEEAANDEALSGGVDLATFAAGATERGDVDGVKLVPAAGSAIEVGRPGEINDVVIHDVEGSGRSAVNTFKTPGKDASADHKKQVFRFDGAVVRSGRSERDANDPVLALVTTGGC